MLFVEKYRPANLDDFCGKSQQIINKYKNGNLLLHGPSGCGKSSIFRIFLKDNHENSIFRSSKYKNNFCIFIEKLNNFVNFKSTNSKIVYIDEFESICLADQQILYEIMKTRKDVRFYITCNDIKKVLANVQAECKIFEFKALSYNDVEQSILKICSAEQISYDKKNFKKIFSECNCDFRKFLSNLQIMKNIFGGKFGIDEYFAIYPKNITYRWLIELKKNKREISEILFEDSVDICAILHQIAQSKPEKRNDIEKLISISGEVHNMNVFVDHIVSKFF